MSGRGRTVGAFNIKDAQINFKGAPDQQPWFPIFTDDRFKLRFRA